MSRVAPAALLLLAFGGCAFPQVQPYYHRSGIPETFAYGGRDGTFPVVVEGNPFAVERAVLEGIVTDAMAGKHQGPNVRMVARRPEDRADVRIVMLFDPPISADGQAVCGDVRALRPLRKGASLRLIAALCTGDQVQSHVRAGMPAVASPRDPAFRSMIEQVMLTILPIHPPDHGRTCNAQVC